MLLMLLLLVSRCFLFAAPKCERFWLHVGARQNFHGEKKTQTADIYTVFWLFSKPYMWTKMQKTSFFPSGNESAYAAPISIFLR